MPITLRPAVLPDCPTLAEIHAEGWRTAYASFMPADFLARLDPARDEQWFQEWVFNPQKPAVAYVAEVDGEIVGFIFAGPEDDENPGSVGEIYKLFIRPAWQGRGLGQQLMDAALIELRRQGYTRLIIWTFQQARSGQFYRKLGYAVVGQTQIEFGGMQHAVDIYGGEL
jgi:GNAT superfamily N-acetyltransferase